MPALKPGTIWPTEEEAAVITAAALTDPDNPPLTDDNAMYYRSAREALSPAEYAAMMDASGSVTFRHVSDVEDAARQAAKRGGRPRLDTPKVSTTIRIDADVMHALRALGRGWQTRINALLREAVAQGRI